MSESGTSLHRSTSIRTLARNDGHKEGHLNIIATRHGWTRTMSVATEEVHNLDYGTLEAVLELNTLRLRPNHLRIFVESPPNSGQYCKIRYWRDDDSLQSILVKQFFNQRMEEGTVTTIDIRDGNDRDDAISVKDGISGSRLLPGGLSRPGETKAWFKNRGLSRSSSLRSRAPTEDGEDGEHAPAPQASRTQALFYFLGITSEPPAPPAKTEEQLAADAKQEEEAMRKRGWMPPVLRRMTSKRSTKSGNKIVSSNPFFSSSERNLIRRKKSKGDGTATVPENGEAPDSEELQMVDAEDGGPKKPKNVQKETKWLRFFSSKPEASADEENPFLGAKEKGKGKQKGKGVEIVGKPTEAFDHSPNASQDE